MEEILAQIRASARLLGLEANDPRVTEALNMVRIATEDGYAGDVAFELARSVLLRSLTPAA